MRVLMRGGIIYVYIFIKIKVETPTDTIEYSYDANDNCIVKSTSSGATTYLVDANTPYAQVIAESREDGTTVEYTYGNDLHCKVYRNGVVLSTFHQTYAMIYKIVNHRNYVWKS